MTPAGPYRSSSPDYDDRDVSSLRDEINRLREQHERDLIHVQEAHAARRIAEAEIERSHKLLRRVYPVIGNNALAAEVEKITYQQEVRPEDIKIEFKKDLSE